MVNTRQGGDQPNIAAIIAEQLQNIIPQIVTQVTANVNNAQNANGGGGGGGQANNGCSYKTFQACGPKEYDGKGGAVALNRWIEKMETVIDNIRGRDAANGMSWNDFKALLVEEFCPSNEMEKLELELWNHKMVGGNHVAYTDRFHELARLVPHMVTPESSRIKRYIAGLAPEIRGMVKAVQPTTIRSAVLRACILTDEAISCGTLSKGSEKRKAEDKGAKSERSWGDEKKAKVGTRFVATAPPRNEYMNYPRQVAPVNAAGNQLAIEGNRGSINNGNQVRGRAYNVNENAEEASRDPNVVTGTFSLNDCFATILFDSGADFSFISTEFVSMLNVKPRIVNPGYEIEIADGKRVEVNRVVCDCKLELGNSLFDIELILIGYGSFDLGFV
ncbi:reverse transcriptase domain-containing protein [Tanacetum coccineum]